MLSTAQSRRALVFSALLAALTCVATMVLTIPSPTGGYLNLGDTVVILGAYLLGPWWGAAAGGLGSALADLFAGYPIYAPATLVIKGCMALLCGVLYRAFGKRTAWVVLCAAAAECVMVVGYWCYDGVLMGSLTGAAVGIPSNLVQAVFGLGASTALTLALRRSTAVQNRFPL